MSTKGKVQRTEVNPPVNSVVFALYGDHYATTSAAHKTNRDEKSIVVRVQGGLSTTAAIQGLRALVSKLEMNGLPVKATAEEWSPQDFVSKSGTGDSR